MRRGEYVSRVKASALEGLAQNGLELESVAITDLDQTDLEFFNPSNRFDAEGLTKLIEDIESRRKLRNDIEQDSMILIRTRNLEAEKQASPFERCDQVVVGCAIRGVGQHADRGDQAAPFSQRHFLRPLMTPYFCGYEFRRNQLFSILLGQGTGLQTINVTPNEATLYSRLSPREKDPGKSA